MTRQRADPFGSRRPARRREYATGLCPVNGSVAWPEPFVSLADGAAQTLTREGESCRAAFATV